MTAWTSAQVAAALGVPAPAEQAFTAISTDTRALRPGALFVALKGERFDAHTLLDAARAAGATAAVVRRGTPHVDALPFFEVDDTLVALGRLARNRRGQLPQGAHVVAVTGSSGKTGTKEMIRAALATRWSTHATAENFNNLVGVPLTILSAPDQAQALVVEAGASEPGEIARLREIIHPTIAVITNVGHAHVEGFGSLEGVMAEKLSLLDGVPLAVVGTEPAALAGLARARTRTVVAGAAPPAEVRPDACRLDDEGRARLEWRGHTVTLPVPGLHQAENAMIALAVAEAAGAEPGPAVRALGEIRLPPGRGTVHRLGGLTVIDDTYNANPGSLRRAVELGAWVAQASDRPLAVVVGSMLELGPESGKLHAALAEEIVARRPALVGAVGEFVEAFEPHRRALGNRLITAGDADALGPKLRAALSGNEVVLVKASRGVALERVLRHLL